MVLRCAGANGLSSQRTTGCRIRVSSTSRRVWTARRKSCSIRTSFPPMARRISEGGSDWRDFYVLDVATKKPLTDHLEWVKFSGASWIGDQGFFYNRYPQPESGKKMAGKNDYQKIYYHKVGTPQSDDKLIYEDNDHPQ